MGMGILYFPFVILSEAKKLCNMASGKNCMGSWLRSGREELLRVQNKREAGIFAASR
jgi:hypothetical protein